MFSLCVLISSNLCLEVSSSVLVNEAPADAVLLVSISCFSIWAFRLVVGVQTPVMDEIVDAGDPLLSGLKGFDILLTPVLSHLVWELGRWSSESSVDRWPWILS